MRARILNSCCPTTSIPTTLPSASKSSMTNPFSDPKGSVDVTAESRNRMYAAVASVSISTTGGSVIGITNPLTLLFPITGDDPAFMLSYFCNYDQNPTFKEAKEQLDQTAVISFARRSLKNRSGLADSEFRLLDRKSPLASALFDVRCVVKPVMHRPTFRQQRILIPFRRFDEPP